MQQNPKLNLVIFLRKEIDDNTLANILDLMLI